MRITTRQQGLVKRYNLEDLSRTDLHALSLLLNGGDDPKDWRKRARERFNLAFNFLRLKERDRARA